MRVVGRAEGAQGRQLWERPQKCGVYALGAVVHHCAVSTIHAERIRHGVVSCTSAGLSLPEYTASVIDLLRRAVPADSACLATTDPATGLVTGSFKVDLEDARDELFAHFEYEVEDVNLFRELAHRPDPVGVLALDTEGHPETSARWRDFLVPLFDVHQELRAAFRADGQAWGAIGLYRTSPTSGFSPAEAAFVADLSTEIGRGLRTAVVTSAATRDRREAEGPAVLVVADDGALSSITPAAEASLSMLGPTPQGELPFVVHALVSACRAFRAGHLTSAPRTRVRAPSGEWFVLHAAPLAATEDASRATAVTIEPARPPDVIPLVVAAHGLTEREQQVVRLVLAGSPTAEIGRRLHLSPYTVQDHLKAIFDKVGVRSRRELAARVFFDQYTERMDGPLGPSGWFAG
jgi:DNA-binding CsgD family transcriptional regulator